ncbi:hypothetical protein [Nitrospirillum viridazoti]|uniref:META domain-containing protein n=1 Tax=Nitrospirillum amazonense TaxID=28077 RepID=A0A560IKU7_9PROT|nr:hypothetical protein [Nitrospirillum amazonense]TWB59656.1 hypothetical protein FBZ92_10789 [Nitrospirillum amazonense]
MRRHQASIIFAALIGLVSGGVRADEAPLLSAPGRPPMVTRMLPKSLSLAGGRWRILAYFDGVAMTVPKRQNYTWPPNAGQTVDIVWPMVEFNSSGVLNIYAGCGPSGGGHYDIAGDKVSLKALALIIGSCGTDDTHQVFAIVDAMRAIVRVAWRGESALLFDQAGNLQLILSP